uniref:Protein quiver n=1 Tax=Ditylenchus dipsaci TaxID=166011 RepID=A0A915DJ08_9BILA
MQNIYSSTGSHPNELIVNAQTAQSQVSTRSRCYSCASENMKENFLSRNRGPKRRKEEPKLYDNMCDLDTWMIREKSAVECDGSCFKWQQVLNNSGVYSYATIRGCYNKMFDLSSPQTEPEKTMNECMARQMPFDCVDQSSLMEWQCFCKGDYCNSGLGMYPTGISVFAGLLTIYLTFVLS